MGRKAVKRDSDYEEPNAVTKIVAKIWQFGWRVVFDALYWIGLIEIAWAPIYYVLGWLHKRKIMETKFMNFGYQYAGQEEKKILKEAEKLISKRLESEQNNVRLYEKTLSCCPYYPDQLAGKHYLEIACGHGGGIEWMLEAHPQLATVFGLDKMVAVEHPNIVQGDALAMPLADCSKDIVQIVEATHAFKDQEPFLSECMRVLKPGGYLVVCDLRPTGSLLEQLYTDAAAAGFKLLSKADITDNVLISRREQQVATKQLYDSNILTRWTMALFWNHFWGFEGGAINEMLQNDTAIYLLCCWQKPA